ncbi:MAG: TIGR03013 family XrtA/PEP-CTERM system glycosyltransferase [Desulfatiglandales bacterium]
MARIFGQYLSLRKVIFIFGEGLLIYAAVSLAAYFFMGGAVTFSGLLGAFWMKILLVSMITQMSLYFNDLYEIKHTGNMVDLATRLIQSVGIASIVLAVVYFLWPEAIIGRWIFFLSIVFLLLFLVSWRFLYTLVITKRLFADKAIMIGSGELAGDIMAEVQQRSDIGYDIRVILGHEKDKNGSSRFEDVPVHYGFNELCKIAETEQASHIIVAMDEKRGIMPYKQLLACKVKGMSVIDGESFYERITGKILVEKINPSWLIFSDGFKKSKVKRIVKRVTGLMLAVLMICLVSPLILLVALAIKLDSRGPVFFSQERVGENGKVFVLYKFRSMRADAEKESGPVWAEKEDIRTTRVGRIIRKLRIDELPQLWNVLKGDMSFVGPRPERPFFVETLSKKIPYYDERFTVKPGVTGWAQIKYPYGASEKDALEKLKYDLFYIKHLSIPMDLMVIFQTVKIVLLGRGSR